MGFRWFAEPAKISQLHAMPPGALSLELEELPEREQVVQWPVDSPVRLKVARSLELPRLQAAVPQAVSLYRLHRVKCLHALLRLDGIGRLNRLEACRDSRAQGLQRAPNQPRYRLAFSLALSPPRILLKSMMRRRTREFGKQRNFS